MFHFGFHGFAHSPHLACPDSADSSDRSYVLRFVVMGTVCVRASVCVCVCVFVVYMSSLFSLDSVKVRVELPASVHYCGTLLCFLLF